MSTTNTGRGRRRAPNGRNPAPAPTPAPTPGSGTPAPQPARRGGLARLIGPRHERHLLTAAQLPALGLPVGDDGVVIGVDADRDPAVLGLFRPEPLEVAFVGGAYVVQIIALRAAAIGARVAIESGRPQLWSAMAQAAGGAQPCVTVHQVGRLGPQGPTPGSPVLVVRDCGARPPRNRLAPAAWQTTLTLLPFLDPAQARQRIGAGVGLIGIQRVSPMEAQAAATVLSLPGEDEAALPTLADELTLWSTRKSRKYVMLTPTRAELDLLGPPRRMD
ncbi:hypothetical protein B4N89_21365 [Embleya scabrispora]|uniref:Uncharacterized protein n=1 Tax=Embleya scabrispora TaxID=159449 RepID=A0A1T3P227_9ACTN|nr:hypothetical protein [Embleya scabrispora]OPC83147.1 hypothetical protein B4N89_21365 [Embleya scabrispora]